MKRCPQCYIIKSSSSFLKNKDSCQDCIEEFKVNHIDTKIKKELTKAKSRSNELLL